MKLVGLLEKGNGFQPYVGLAVLIGVLLYFMHKQFELFLKRKREDRPYVLAYITILSITIVLMKIISLFQNLNTQDCICCPSCDGNNTCKTNDWWSICLLTSMIFSVCGSIMFNEGVTSTLNYSVGIYVLLSSLSVSIFLREKIVVQWFYKLVYSFLY